MITLGDLKIKLNFAVGTSETNLLTVEKREDALNRAIQIILEQYPIPQYVISPNLTFTNGVATLPDDCVMPLKLVSPTDAYTIYSRVGWDKFPYNIPQTYTIRWDTATNLEKIYIYPTTATSLTFYYVQNQETLVDDADECRFNPWWANPIAEKAAEILLTDTANFNRAQAKQIVADNLMAKAWQIERQRITGVQDNKLTSIYQQTSLLGGNRSSITGT